ncbi:MAG: hypothetical protein ABIN91_08385 [Mucilaginibacter sp.]|uniref:hypothetical protein n=1 Tax=Mucilaginibacter sp. TaxID=1882438 RepID=UPI003264267D
MTKLLLILMISVPFCPSSSKAQNKPQPIVSTPYYRQQLIGKWGIYVSIANGSSILYNVCPKISFNPDNSAEIVYPDGSKEKMKWEMLENAVLDINANHTFTYPPYQIDFKQMKEYMELTLSSKDKRRSYILRRLPE